MRSKLYRAALAIVFLMLLFIIGSRFRDQSQANIHTLPSLPRPIAKEAVLITSAGQSTDTYIIRDIANQLMIRNFFMPQAKDTDLKDIHTLVFVIGYSPLGTKLHGISYEDEKKRIKQLLEKSKNENLTVLTVYIGGKQRRGNKTDELLMLICPGTNYLIGLRESNDDGFLSELARANGIPLTLVKGINDISGPFASAFR